MEEQYLQLGTVAVLFLICIREFFSYLRSKQVNGTVQGAGEILAELKLINANHLGSIERTNREGDRQIVDAINTGNQKIVEILGEIRGKLSR